MKEYMTNCVESSADIIDKMCEQAIEIDYNDFITQVEVKHLVKLFPQYDWTDGDDLKLIDDWHVSYWQSQYLNRECVYVEHSCVEYIFC